MAFKDITKVLYNGSIKLDYKDKAHRYYARERINWDLSPEDAKAWSKIIYPKGTTTLLGDTLEKKGLMQWPKNVALRELFGFYGSFESDGNKIPAGFSKGVGTMWEDGKTRALTQEELLPLVLSAADNWKRKQKKGADIGTVVHDAIEHYVLAHPNNPDREPSTELFDIAEQYMWNIKEAEYESDAAFDDAMARFPEEVEQAKLAFASFVAWWEDVKPVLYAAEDLLYSKKHNVCGTFDGDIGIPLERHPMSSQWDKPFIRCTTDWKTSSAYGDAPEGVSYDYFAQSAIYELMRREMGFDPADDLLVVSARKDGGFNTVFASELGYTVEECVAWAEAIILCYRMREKGLNGLKAHAENAAKPELNKEAF